MPVLSRGVTRRPSADADRQTRPRLDAEEIDALLEDAISDADTWSPHVVAGGMPAAETPAEERQRPTPPRAVPSH